MTRDQVIPLTAALELLSAIIFTLLAAVYRKSMPEDCVAASTTPLSVSMSHDGHEPELPSGSCAISTPMTETVVPVSVKSLAGGRSEFVLATRSLKYA